LLFSPGFATFFAVLFAKIPSDKARFDKISTCRADFFRKTVFTNGRDYGKVVPFFFAQKAKWNSWKERRALFGVCENEFIGPSPCNNISCKVNL